MNKKDVIEGIQFSLYIIITFFIMFFIIVTPFILIGVFDDKQEIKATEKAITYCNDKGYEAYDTFKRIIYSAEPRGIICRNIKNEYNVEIVKDKIKQ